LLAEAADSIQRLLKPDAEARRLKELSAHYSANQVGVELVANTIADALCARSQWDSEQLFDNWPEVQAVARALWKDANPISPSALSTADDADLSRGAGQK
jgi:hypothetical protein